MEISKFFFAFWWLIFPVMGFGMGAFRNWLNYRRQRDAVDLLKAYAASGREPPPEILAAVTKLSTRETDGDWSLAGSSRPGSSRLGMWFPGLMMFAFAGAFAFATTLPRYADNQGLRFVLVLFLLLGTAFIAAHFIARAGAHRLGSPDGRTDGQ